MDFFYSLVPCVKDVAIDATKDLVKVSGTMDAAGLPLGHAQPDRGRRCGGQKGRRRQRQEGQV